MVHMLFVSTDTGHTAANVGQKVVQCVLICISKPAMEPVGNVQIAFGTYVQLMVGSQRAGELVSVLVLIHCSGQSPGMNVW